MSAKGDPDYCDRCDGDGWVETFDDDGFVMGATECPKCGGLGTMAAGGAGG